MNNRIALSRRDLERMGIINVNYDCMLNKYYIIRHTKRKGINYEYIKYETRMKKVYKCVPPVIKRAFTFKYNGQSKSIQLGRLLYAWWVGDIPEGMEVAFKDGNTDNFTLTNLELVTTKEQCRRRWTYLKDLRNMEKESNN